MGGAVGYYFGRKSGLAVADKEISEMEDYYETSDRYRRTLKEEEPEVDSENSSGEENRENGPLSAGKRAEIREKLGKNWSKTTNYAEKYHKNTQNEDSEEEEETPAMAANRFHEENRDRPPELISEEAIDELPGFFDRQLLYYFAYDESVTDEDEILIDEPGHMLGMVMEETGFIEDNTDLIYVVNYQTDCVYEVQKVLASYCETHEIVMSEEGGVK